MGIKLIATDLDGTLFLPDSTIGKMTAETVKKCVAKGIHFTIASGRTFCDVRKRDIAMGIAGPLISYNGPRVDLSPTGPTIAEKFLEPEIVEKVLEILENSGLYYDICTKEGIYMSEADDSYGDSLVSYGWKITGDKTAERWYDSGYHEIYCWDKSKIREAAKHGVYKLNTDCNGDTELLKPVYEKLKQLPVHLIYVSNCTSTIEILPQGCTKGWGLKKLAEALSIPMDEIMAFGDHVNDVEMLETAEISFAMENANYTAKNAAVYMAPANTVEGEALVLQDVILDCSEKQQKQRLEKYVINKCDT